MLLCLRTLILSLPRSDCGSTAGASTNRSILQSEKRPKIILNTYSEVFGAAYGYRLFFWTALLSCLEEGRGHGEGTTCKTLSHVKHYICTQRLFEVTRVPNLQSNFNLSPVTAIFWLLNCPSPTPSFCKSTASLATSQPQYQLRLPLKKYSRQGNTYHQRCLPFTSDSSP